MSYNIYQNFTINFEELSYKAVGGDNNCYFDRKLSRFNMDFVPTDEQNAAKLKDLMDTYGVEKETAFIYLVIKTLGNSSIKNTVSEKIRNAIQAVKVECVPEATTVDFMYHFTEDKENIVKAVETFKTAYSNPIKKKEAGEWIVELPSLKGYARGIKTYTLKKERAKVFKTLITAEKIANYYPDSFITKIA